MHVGTTARGLWALSCLCLAAGCAAPPPPRLAFYASLPLSGPAAERAQAVLAGFQTALQAQNQTACGGRYALRLVTIDHAAGGVWDATIEMAAANKAAADSEAVGYLAGFEPGPLIVSLPILNQAGPLLAVAPMNTYPAFTFPLRPSSPSGEYYPIGRRSLLRLGPTDFEIGAAAARWAARAGAESVSILFDQSDPAVQGLNVARGIEAEAAGLGLPVNGSLGVDRSAAEYDSIVRQVALQSDRDRPALLFYAGPPADHLGRLFAAIRAGLDNGGRAPVLAAPGFAALAFAQAAGPAAEAALLLSPALPEAEWPRAGREFAERYAAAAGETPGVDALYGYGAAQHLLQAVEAVCKAHAPVTRRAVLQRALTRPAVPGRFAGEVRAVQALPAPDVFAVYRITGGTLDFLETTRAGR